MHEHLHSHPRPDATAWALTRNKHNEYGSAQPDAGSVAGKHADPGKHAEPGGDGAGGDGAAEDRASEYDARHVADVSALLRTQPDAGSTAGKHTAEDSARSRLAGDGAGGAGDDGGGAGGNDSGGDGIGGDGVSEYDARRVVCGPAQCGLRATQYILLDESRELADRRTIGACSSPVMLSPWAIGKSTHIAGRLVLAMPWQWMPWRARQVTKSSSLRREAELLIMSVAARTMLSQVFCDAHAR